MIPWPDLEDPPPGQGLGGRDAAVVVAVEDYAFVPDVPGAGANGRAWTRWLKESRGVAAVRVLRDEQATREAMLEAAAGAAARVEPGGTLWVVFIGHGAPGGSLVGVDAQGSDAGLRHRSIPTDTLLEAARGAQARTVMVVDACFSGLTAAGEPLAPGLQPMVPTRIREAPGTTMLLAAASDQVAGPLPGSDRPAFSYLVLGALRGWGDADGDGNVTASEAVDYASGVLFERAADRLQEPQLSGPDMVLAKASERAPRPPPSPVPSPKPRPAPDPVPEPPRPPEPAVVVVLPPPAPAPPAPPAPPVRPRPKPRVKLPKLLPKRRDRPRAPAEPHADAAVTVAVGALALVLAALGWWLYRSE